MKKLLLAAVLALGSTTLFAQSDYNFQKRSLFELLPVTSQDVVFLGNSITDGGEWCELFDDARVKNRGISGDCSDWLLDRLDPIVAGRPAKLFLMIGTNDLALGKSVESVLANITELVERFQTESPRTKLYLQSVLPVNNHFQKFAGRHGKHDKDIVQLNEGLRKLCEQKGIDYIDLWTVMADSHGKLRRELTNDGLHLMGIGYLLWRDTVLPYVKR